MDLHQLYQRLNLLKFQKQSIENEILKTKKAIEQFSPFSKQQKISLFQSLFIARKDVYAQYWVSRDGTKKGYSPRTYTFKGKDYIPISNLIVQQHLEGKIRLGTYAIINQTMTKFLVLDLDKASFVEDARAINEVCKELQITPLFEISKSGNGIHIWFFFETLVRASSVRKLGDILLTKAMDLGSGIDMSSYDRMFPNQDFVAPDALGNLVALPLHYGSRKENKTVFIDINTIQPYPDQWVILKNIVKISFKQLENLLIENIVQNKKDEVGLLMPWEVNRTVPLSFPKITQAVLYDALYIEKAELSKTLINKLKKLASFTNPEFYIRQNLRKSTFNIPRVVSLFDANEKYLILPRGLKEKIQNLFQINSAIFMIEDKRFIKKIEKSNLTIELQDKQKKAFSKILKNEYAIFIAPPGFGKTAIASAVIAKRGVNTLILVHKITLLEQWKTKLSEYFGVDKKSFGQLGKGKKKLTSIIDVAMLQSLKNKPEIIQEYSQIIIDEAHHIPAISFEVPLKKFCGKYVVALSATPKRQDGMHPIMLMQCGEIVFEIKRNISIIHTLKAVRTKFETLTDEFSMILTELVKDFDRNELIIGEISKLKNRRILVLSERIEHLNILYHGLKNRGLQSTLLYGGMSTKVQKEALKEAHKSNIVLSTSGYIGEGIDFAHLDTIVFTMPISYKGRIIQYLGRIGRRNQACLAIDFVDENVTVLKSSFNKRLKGYKQMGYSMNSINLFS